MTVVLIGFCLDQAESVPRGHDCKDKRNSCTTVKLPPHSQFSCDEFCQETGNDGGVPLDSTTCSCIRETAGEAPITTTTTAAVTQTQRVFSYSDCLDPQYKCTQVIVVTLTCDQLCRLLGYHLGGILFFDLTTSETLCFCIERIIVYVSTILRVISTTSYRQESSHVTGTDDTRNEVTSTETFTAGPPCATVDHTYRSKDTTTTIPPPTKTPGNNIPMTTTTIPPPTTTSVHETTPVGNPCNNSIDLSPIYIYMYISHATVYA